MKLVKAVLLGSVAGLVSVASAQAADLPTRKAAPAEYVRVCDAQGVGFFFIPGTQTCLRISGFVRAEYGWQNIRLSGAPGGVIDKRGVDAVGFRALSRLNFDVRTQTAWGTLRTFIRLEASSNSGVYGGASPATLILGYIQFAGLTAGKAQSFYDFYANDINWGTKRGSDSTPRLLAYTATFGNGYSATLSIEDKVERSYATAGAVQAGIRYPDLVGALRVDQGWGSAQLSAAVGQRNITGPDLLGDARNKDYTFWAVQGGVKFDLSTFAAGDSLTLQAAYSQGGGTGYVLGAGSLDQPTGYYTTQADAILRQSVGSIGVSKSKAWGVLAAGVHYWTPSVRQQAYLGYAQLTYAGAAKAVGWANQREFRVGSALIWSPVAEFDIGVELMYAKTVNKVDAITAAQIRAAGLKKDPDAFEARLRLQRDF